MEATETHIVVSQDMQDEALARHEEEVTPIEEDIM